MKYILTILDYSEELEFECPPEHVEAYAKATLYDNDWCDVEYSYEEVK